MIDLMGRNAKRGLDYFPMDISIFSDLKIRKLIKRQGGKAITVYAYLLCCIYKEGYYIQWDKELPFICSEFTGYDEAYISEVIKSCLSLGLFDKALFDASQVLTSRGVQERYQRICQQSRRVCQIDEYNLVNPKQPSQAAPRPSNPKGKERHSEAQTPGKAQEGTVTHSLKANTASHSTIDEEIKLLKQETSWIDQLQCLHGITAEQIRLRIDDFATECKANGKESHDSLSDAKHHFNSWLRLTTQKDNNDATDKARRNTKRTGNILPHDAAKKKDYGSSF